MDGNETKQNNKNCLLITVIIAVRDPELLNPDLLFPCSCSNTHPHLVS
jgi:hypothetical protein